MNLATADVRVKRETPIRGRPMRIVPRGRVAQSAAVFTVAALALTIVLFAGAAQSRGAAAGTQASSNVVVIPGFSPHTYPPYYGIPTFPTNASALSTYHFSQLAAGQVTADALKPYDTVILYGYRWGDLSSTAQQAIDAFAQTHKVLIWDADDTGSQSYSTFVHPFSTTASGENGHSNDSVVSFPGGNDFLASDSSSSPYYLDPNQLVTDRNMINDMDAMQTGTPGWTPALVAANKNVPNGGWVLAWAYGDVGNHTGLVIYSGIDADAFGDALSPNYAIKEVALELSAPFSETPVASCAPNCQPPPPPPAPGGGSSGSGTYATCSFAPAAPTRWVHGNVVIGMKTSVAAGIVGKIMAGNGKTVASAREHQEGLLRLLVRTRRLPSNRVSLLRAVVLYQGRTACTQAFRLKVDNVRPRLLLFRATRTSHADVLELRVSKRSTLTLRASGVRRKATLVAARRTVLLHLPLRVRAATIMLRDRAGNDLVRRVSWR